MILEQIGLPDTLIWSLSEDETVGYLDLYPNDQRLKDQLSKLSNPEGGKSLELQKLEDEEGDLEHEISALEDQLDDLEDDLAHVRRKIKAYHEPEPAAPAEMQASIAH